MANKTVYPYGTGGSLPSSIGIVNDPFTGGADKAWSAAQGKELNEKLYAPETIDLSSPSSVAAFISDSDNWVENYQSYAGKFLTVCPGEKYVIQGNTTNYSLIAILTTNKHENKTSIEYATGWSRMTIGMGKYYEFEVPADGHYLFFSTFSTVDITPASLKRIRSPYSAEDIDEKFYVPVDLTDYPALRAYPGSNGWITDNNNYHYYGVFVPCEGGDKFAVDSILTYGVAYTFLTSDSHIKNQTPNYATGYGANPVNVTNIGKSILVAPLDARYLYIVASYDSLSHYVLPSSIYRIGDITDSVAEVESVKFPTILKMGDSQNVLYTRDNVLIKYGTENGTDYIYFSDDLGKTWTTLENTYGDITHIHLFSTGTVLFCTKQAAYYTKDFVTVNQATVYDYDGSTTVPSGTRFYSIPKPHRERTYIDGNEWHTFWDYVIDTTNPRCWYSNDDGHTVRCAFAFGLQSIGGTTVPARHVHDFQYNRYDGKFYCFTGDSVTECHIMRGTLSGGAISWEKLKTGGEYKLVSIDFDEGNFYAVTDYTESSLANKKGIIRCPISSIDDDNFDYLFHATNTLMGRAALSCYFCDKNGWRVCGTDYLGGPKTLIAKNNWDLVWVDNSKQYRLWSMMGPNDNGDIYCHLSSTSGGGGSVSGEGWLKLNIQSFNLTDAMRNSGATNFCDYKISKY